MGSFNSNCLMNFKEINGKELLASEKHGSTPQVWDEHLERCEWKHAPPLGTYPLEYHSGEELLTFPRSILTEINRGTSVKKKKTKQLFTHRRCRWGVSLNRDVCLPATAEACNKRGSYRLSTNNTFSCNSVGQQPPPPATGLSASAARLPPTPAACAPPRPAPLPPGNGAVAAGSAKGWCPAFRGRRQREPPDRGPGGGGRTAPPASGTRAGRRGEAGSTPPPRPRRTPRRCLLPRPPPQPQLLGWWQPAGDRGDAAADPALLPPAKGQPATPPAQIFRVHWYFGRALSGRQYSDVHSNVLVQMSQFNNVFALRKQARWNVYGVITSTEEHPQVCTSCIT